MEDIKYVIVRTKENDNRIETNQDGKPFIFKKRKKAETLVNLWNKISIENVKYLVKEINNE
jgi:hypothetical protein